MDDRPQPNLPDVGPEHFRTVLGKFPTGVAVVTARGAGGEIAGMTVGSFTSVSLDPPLVGFLPATSSSSFGAIRDAGAFCVNVLAADQVSVCRAFATKKGEAKFEGTSWTPSPSGAPILDGAIAWIDCTMTEIVEAGDHYIVLGRVNELSAQRDGADPMVFYRGGYGRFHVPSLTAPAEADLVDALRHVDVCRPAMERVARELETECFAVSLVHDDMVFIGSSGGDRTVRATRIGRRVPVIPPLGTIFFAWSSEERRQRWLQQAISRAFASADLEALLETVRARGWCVTLLNDDVRRVEAELQSVGHRLDETAGWDGLAEQLQAVRPEAYALGDLASGERYEVSSLMAPVFGEDGEVVLALTLLDFEKDLTGAELDRVAAVLTDAAREATAAAGGTWVVSAR